MPPADLRALRDAVVEARADAAIGCECKSDECCDRCRVAAILTGPSASMAHAERALADAISPEVVELVEAMRAWAEARAAKRAAVARDSAEATQESFVSWALAADEERASFVAVQALADRLAEKGGE